MKLTGETKIFIGIGIVTLLLIIGAVFMFSRQEQASQNIPVYSREELLPSGTPIKGNASASAYLVEFSDFQCPACKAFAPIVKQITDTYADKIAVGYRHYPLPQHPFAVSAAKAAEAANRQGKFWEMHDELFANQESLSDTVVQDIAKKLELETEAFGNDLANAAVTQKVEQDRIAGNRFGVNATPTFFLNGQKVSLRSPQDLFTAVESALKTN